MLPLPPENVILQNTIDTCDKTIDNLCNQLAEERKVNTELLDALRQCNDFFASVNDGDLPERLAMDVALAIVRHGTR